MEPIKFGMKDPNAIVMSGIARKQAAGGELTGMENNIAQVITGIKTGEFYGPGPRDMAVAPEQLPENVKGIISSYTNV